MPFKIDYRDGDVIEWELGGDGAPSHQRNTDYTPIIYVSGDSEENLEAVRPHIEDFPTVTGARFTSYRTVWRKDPEPVLQLDIEEIDDVTDVASGIRGWGDPGEYKLYNVDFSREFRYCLENDLDPGLPDGVDPTTCEITVPPKALSDGEVAPMEINDSRVDSSEVEAIEALSETLATDDPDILILNSSDLVPLLYQKALEHERPSFELGRLPGYQRLASESTFESYGRVGHSPARYNVPGRAIIDTSNSFFWNQTSVAGLFDLVEKSRKPLQETSWASIGNVFTAIQIRQAMQEGVLVPWNSWRHEKFKSMRTLHDADRGGFIFSPEVGFHEDVHELDFSSLYPNIMITRNVSPDVILCDCHADREDVSGLGYNICDKEGYLVRVLDPLVSAREEYKAELRTDPGPERTAELKSMSNALKWILVSCFGYQGFSNAKFGRIECHEAINAYAREILLDTKELLEANGWSVIHGIVDSVWVSAIPGREQTPLNELAPAISREINIPLDYEAHYDWIAFAPRKDSDEGALNRYFAKVKGEDEFKKRGIELRQRSTPTYIEECQAELLRVLDEEQSPEPVCDRLQVQLQHLQRGEVDPSDLEIRRRVSKSVDEYTQYTVNVAALERAEEYAFEVSPGEDIEFVVVDDGKQSKERVALAFEDPERYDKAFYSTLLIRAAESIISPLNWDRTRIRSYLSDAEDAKITAY